MNFFGGGSSELPPENAPNWRERAYAKMKTQGYEEYPGPDGKEGQMGVGCLEDDDPRKSTYINRLKFDLANSYYWSGSMIKDYFYFVMQWHPVLGVLMCHPDHPWTKLDRFCMLLISAGLTFIPSCGISKGCDRFTGVEHLANGTLANTEGDTAAAEAANTACSTASLLLFVTIPDTVIGVLLYQLAIANTRCPSCADFWRAVMKCCVGCSFFLVLVTGAIGMVMLDGEPPREAIMIMAKGKLYSWVVIWFPMWILLPCQLGFLSLWCAERKAAARAQQ